jgi:uncharacterized protein YndB with AHSA1/START domain
MRHATPFGGPSRNLTLQWWGRGNKLIVERLELRSGGFWRFVEHSDDGVLGFEGQFLEVTQPERIVWTFGWDGIPGQVAVEATTFEDLGNGWTKVISRSRFQTEEDRDAIVSLGMLAGRNLSYAALDQLVAESTGDAGAQKRGWQC